MKTLKDGTTIYKSKLEKNQLIFTSNDGEKISSLSDAVTLERPLTLTEMLQTYSSFFCNSENINNALIDAASKNKLEMLQELVYAGADINFVTSSGENALNYAIFHQNLPMVTFLLGAGAKTSLKPISDPAILSAALVGNIEIAKLLLKLGANIDETAIGSYDTPFHAAAAGGHEHFIVFLLEKNGPCITNIMKKNANGLLPIDAAKLNGREKCYQYLDVKMNSNTVALESVKIQVNVTLPSEYKGKTPKTFILDPLQQSGSPLHQKSLKKREQQLTTISDELKKGFGC